MYIYIYIHMIYIYIYGRGSKPGARLTSKVVYSCQFFE